MKVFLIAGEASGDVLGAALMAGLKKHQPDVTFQGVGGAQMEAEGMQSLFPMHELSVMGLAEVLPKYRHLKRRIAQTAEAAIAAQPDVLISIDSPDFCLRVAKLVKAGSTVRTVHYVAPSVWAWRPKRADKMARVIDHVLALLPFEPPYMEAAGTACDFVGHPAASIPVVAEAEKQAFRARHDVAEANPLLLVLPGSRRGEVKRLGPRIGQALEPVVARHPQLRVVLPAARNVVDQVREVTSAWPVAPVILDPTGQPVAQAETEKRIAFAAADFALATSGTVALELAAADTPMVSVFDLNWLSREIIKRMVRVDTGNLINLVTDTRTVPEFVGENCVPNKIGAGVMDLIRDASAQRQAMADCMDALGRGGVPPGERAALAVLKRMGVQQLP